MLKLEDEGAVTERGTNAAGVKAVTEATRKVATATAENFMFGSRLDG